MKTLQSITTLFILLFTGCIFDNHDDDKFTLEFKSIEKIEIDGDIEISVSIYGYDRNIADASATLLKKFDLTLSRLPANFELEYSQSWKDKVEPRSKSNSSISYYLSLDEDIELSTDYENTNNGDGPKFVKKLSDLSQTIYLKENNSLITHEDSTFLTTNELAAIIQNNTFYSKEKVEMGLGKIIFEENTCKIYRSDYIELCEFSLGVNGRIKVSTYFENFTATYNPEARELNWAGVIYIPETN